MLLIAEGSILQQTLRIGIILLLDYRNDLGLLATCVFQT